MIPRYQNALTPEEYNAYVNHGASMALVSAAQVPGMAKHAQGVGSAVAAASSLGDQSTRLLLALSVVTGVPVGIMMHVIGKRIGERRLGDKQITDEASYYRNAARSLETEMARQGLKTGEAAAPGGGGSFITNGLKDDARSPIPKAGVETMKSEPQVPPAAGYLKKVVNANIPNPGENTPKPSASLKVSYVLDMLKRSQESEIETGDEESKPAPEAQPALPIPEPSGLLAAVGERPKDDRQQQQQQPRGPTANNEVVNKSNITAPGQMPAGSQRSQLS